MDDDVKTSEEAVRFWIETRLRDAIDDPVMILQSLALMKVAYDRGDSPDVMIKKVIAGFIFSAFDMSIGGE